MGIISSPLFTDAKGTLGNIIIYKVKNQVRIRAKPLVHKDRKSPKQLKQRAKLKTALALYQKLDYAFKRSWQICAETSPMNGCNLFIRENIGNIGPDGEIIDWAELKINHGPLLQANHLRVAESDERTVTVSWDTETLEAITFDDLVQIGVYGYLEATEEESIYYLRETKSNRKTGRCTFEIPEGKGILHFYICFKSIYTNESSDSLYIGSWEAKQKAE